jgi:arginine:ornithine antiporter/lysine permease
MAAQAEQKVPRATLTAMVVGGMVGAGVFSIPRNFAQATGVYGALIAWAIAGAGMLMLAFVFQTLANRKPDLDAGVYAYARAGFGPYLGFFSAFGYWASACVGNVSYWVLIGPRSALSSPPSVRATRCSRWRSRRSASGPSTSSCCAA